MGESFFNKIKRFNAKVIYLSIYIYLSGLSVSSIFPTESRAAAPRSVSSQMGSLRPPGGPRSSTRDPHATRNRRKATAL